MGNRSTLQIIVALAFAISSLVFTALPAAADTVLVQCSGTCGYWEVSDTGPTGPKGAVCGYANGTQYLAFISVRPPLMHGNYSSKTKVAWRFKIRHAPAGGSFSTIHTSSWQSARADDAIPAYAGNGFTRRFWNKSPNPYFHGWFQVWVEMAWWNHGSLEGTARDEYDWYKATWQGSSYSNQDFCFESY